MSTPPLFSGCGGQILGVFISCGKNASSLGIILLVAVLWLAFLFKTFSKSFCPFVRTHSPTRPRLYPEVYLTFGFPSRNRKTPWCNVIRKTGQGPRSGTVVSFAGVQLCPHWESTSICIFLLRATFGRMQVVFLLFNPTSRDRGRIN